MESPSEVVPSVCSRRELLATAGTVAGVGVAGCLSAGGDAVHVLSAGSLATTFEDHVGPAFESETATDLRGEYFGTNALVRMVEERTTVPDVIVSADATLLRERLAPEWDIEFATNSLGISYDPETTVGSALEEGTEPWYELLGDVEEGKVAISDPNLDPLGYRAIQAFELAEQEHDIEGFRERMLETVYTEPEEPQLMAGIETGSTATAVVYRNMAVDHDIPFREFPSAYNFADPSLASHYGTVSYTTDDGYTADGRPILYNATVHSESSAPESGRELVQFLADRPELLSEAGLTVSEPLPAAHGSTPEGITV